jgi:hypothetical protein
MYYCVRALMGSAPRTVLGRTNQIVRQIAVANNHRIGENGMLRKALRAHRYLAYQLYLWHKSGDSSAPEGSALIGMAVSTLINVGTIGCVTHLLFGVWIPPMAGGPYPWVALAAIMMGAYLWFWLARERFEKIKREFGDQTDAASRVGRRIIGIYLIGTIILAILVPILTISPSR